MIARIGDFQSHVLVEADRRIVAVYIQFDYEGRRVVRLQVSDALLDDEASDTLAVHLREGINLLEIKAVPAFGFDGKISDGAAVGPDNKELVMLLDHLFS